MAIITQETYTFRGNPLRLYVHSTNLEAAFGSAENALDYGLRTIHEKSGILRPAQWIVAFTYGWPDENVPPSIKARAKLPLIARMMDVFGFHSIQAFNGQSWKQNPTIRSWVLKNGIRVQDQNIACGIEAIVLGKEEELRLSTKNIDEYARKKIELPNCILSK